MSTGSPPQPYVATLGARPALPFTLQAVVPLAFGNDLILSILDRLDQLQEISARSQLELSGLRELNVAILDAVTRRPPEANDDSAHTPSERATPKLMLHVLGAFEARIGDQLVSAWPGRKARLLLAYLALERGRMVPRDALIEMFWPEAREDRGANNLSIAVHQIRSTLAAVEPRTAQAVIVRQGLYGIDPALVWVDLWDLQAFLDEARRALECKDKPAVHTSLRKAVSLCRGELLDSDRYEDWAEEPRRILNAAWHQALTWLATEASLQGDWSAVFDFAGQILQRDGCDETAHRLMIKAHLQLGNRSQAMLQYNLCVETLRRELGVRPSPETRRIGEGLSD